MIGSTEKQWRQLEGGARSEGKRGVASAGRDGAFFNEESAH